MGMVMKLMVRSVTSDDFFQDMVRVHPSHRRADVKAGSLCRVQLEGNSKYIIGIARNRGDKNCIWLDSAQRRKLGVKAGEEADFREIQPASWFQQLNWLWNATDPWARTAGRLGIISIWLGVLGVVLGFWSLYLAVR
jgi:hypothetical protein